MKVHINGETYTLPMSDEQLTAHHLTTDMTVTVPDLTEIPFSHIYDIKHIFSDPNLTLEEANTFSKYAEIREDTITHTQGLAEYIAEYPGKTSIYEIMDIIEQANDDKLNFTEFYYPGIDNDLSADIDEKLGETYFYLNDYESKIDAAQDELGEVGRYLTFNVGAYGRDLRLSGTFILTDEGFIDRDACEISDDYYTPEELDNIINEEWEPDEETQENTSPSLGAIAQESRNAAEELGESTPMPDRDVNR